MELLVLTVASDGNGEYAKIGSALAVAEKNLNTHKKICVKVASGTYREKLRVMIPGIEIRGAGQGQTRIVWDDHARRLLDNGEPMGTFNSYTVYIGADNVRISELCIENDAGDGRLVGQAVALYADADNIELHNCSLLARQDTLCIGPLPSNPVPKGINLLHSVAGLPGFSAPLFKQRYINCLIAGDVDFIFGSSSALFKDCEIRSLQRDGLKSWICAPSTLPEAVWGFVFVGCSLTSDTDDCTVYLGRPWRVSAKALFLGCGLGAHIRPEAWHDWDKEEAHTKTDFVECASCGVGATAEERPAWVRLIDSQKKDDLLDSVEDFFDLEN